MTEENYRACILAQAFVLSHMVSEGADYLHLLLQFDKLGKQVTAYRKFKGEKS